jgi:hypothetical protein
MRAKRLKALCLLWMALAGPAFADVPSVDLTSPGALSLSAGVGRQAERVLVARADAKLAVAEQRRIVTGFKGFEASAYRTIITVNGRHPYTMVLEDYAALPEAGLVELELPVASDVELAGFRYDRGGDDVLLRRGEGPPMALRVLKASAAADAGELQGRRTGRPAILVTQAPGRRSLVLPVYTGRPSFRVMSLADARDVPACKWLDGGRVLRVEWYDQVDVFTLETGESGRTRFLLERKRGEHADEVLSFGIAYVPPKPVDGNLIAHWSFDKVEGRTVKDVSGNGYDATMEGGVRTVPGLVGDGMDGVSAEGLGRSELLVPTPEGKLPARPEFGRLRIPAGVFKPIADGMTITFWYAMPPSVGEVYHAYYRNWPDRNAASVLRANGVIRLYCLCHWLNGHQMTAEALGDHRLFGMWGPVQPKDMWNHYAIVLDRNEGRLYINGDLKAQKTGKRVLDGATVKGEFAEALENVWARMDELRIYDYPLSLDEIQTVYRSEGQERLCRLDFDETPAGMIEKGTIRDEAGNECPARNVEIIPRDGGKALRFARKDAGIVIPPALTDGKHMDAVSFAVWVRLPEDFKGRGYLLHSDVHGHMGMFVGFWRDRLWGRAAQNAFEGSVTPGRWTHVITSYGHNRIRTWIDGHKVQDDDKAYPGRRGWGVGPFSLTFAPGLEIDDVQLFSFALTDEQAAAVCAGEDVLRPDVPEPPDGQKTVVKARHLEDKANR